MGWGRYLLLGNFGQQLDLEDHEATLRRLRQSIISSHMAERDQAALMDSVRQENLELRVCLTALIQLLIKKGAITPDEMSELAATVERSAQPAPQAPSTESPTSPDDTSPELMDLQRAVDEQNLMP